LQFRRDAFEYLRDYAFRLRPDDDKNPMRVHFRLMDAAEGEHGNVKEQTGKERRFKLTPAPFAAVEDGELVIREIGRSSCLLLPSDASSSGAERGGRARDGSLGRATYLLAMGVVTPVQSTGGRRTATGRAGGVGGRSGTVQI